MRISSRAVIGRWPRRIRAVPAVASWVWRARLTILAAAAAANIAAPPEAAAQSVRTWNVTTGTWATSGNWLGGTPTASDTAYFSGPDVGDSDVTALLSANFAMAGLSFNNGGATIFRGSTATVRTGTIGTGGITMANGAGPVSIGVTGSLVNLILAGTQTWTNNSANPLTILGVVNTAGVVGSDLTIDGSGPTTMSGVVGTGGTGRVISITKQGTGVLTLSAANTFTGGLTLSSGTLVIANPNVFGGQTTSVIRINGGSLDVTGTGAVSLGRAYVQNWNDSFTFVGTNSLVMNSGAVTLGASPTVTVNSSTLTVQGAIGDGGNGYSLTKEGAGALVLTGANTFTGGVTHSAGTLIFGGNSALGAADGAFTMADGVSLDVTSNAGRILTNPVQTWNGSFSFLGANTLSLGTNTVTLGASSTVTVVTNTLTVGGNIGDGGAARGLTKAGNGTLVLNGSNTFTGGVTLAGGLLRLGNDAALGGAGGVFTITGGTFDVTAARTIAANNAQAWDGDVSFVGFAALNLGSGSVSLGTSPVVTVNSSTLTVGGVIGDGGAARGLTKSGNGTLLLAAANTFGGGVTLSAGTLSLGDDAALGTGTFTIAGGAIIATAPRATANDNAQNWNDDFAFVGTSPLDLGTGAVTLGGTGDTRTVTVSSSTLTVGGAIGGGYGLTKTGNGSLVLNGSSSYTGTTTIAAGALEAGDANALGTSGPIVFAGGRLRYSAASATTDFGTRFRDSAAAIVVDLNGQDVSLSGIDATNTGGLSWVGTTSALTLTGTNSHSGGTTLGTSQRLNLDSPQALGNGALILGGNGTVDNTSGGPVTIAATVAASDGSLTFAGSGAPLAFSGTFLIGNANRGVTVSGGTMSLATIDADTTARAFNFTGPGTLVLTAASGTTFEGGFKHGNGAAGGTLIISSTGAIGTGPLTFDATGGTGVLQAGIDLSGPQALANAVTLAAATNFTVSGSNSITFAGPFTQSGGSRQLTNNLVEGKSLVVAGTTFLREPSGGTTRTLTLAGSGDTVFSGPIVNGGTAGVGSLSIDGGRVTLSASNSYSGNTTLTSGTLDIGHASALGASTLVIDRGALSVSGSFTLTNTLATLPSTTTGVKYVGPGELYLAAPMLFGNYGTYLPGRILAIESGTLGLGDIVSSGLTRGYTKTGDGTLVISGTNNTGQFSLEGGVARLVGSGSFTSGVGTSPGMRVVTGTADYGNLSRTEGALVLGGTTYLGAVPDGRAAILTGSGTLTVTGNVVHNSGTWSGSPAGVIAGNLALVNASQFLISVHESTNTDADLTISANIVVTTATATPQGLRKQGAGTLALSGSNAWSTLIVNNGVVRVDAASVLPSSLVTLRWDDRALPPGMLGLTAETGTFTRTPGTDFGISTNEGGGFAAYGGTRTVNLGGGATPIGYTWAVGGFVGTSGTGTLAFGSADADGTVDFLNPIALGGSGTSRTIMVYRGSAATDAKLSGTLSGSAGLVKAGDGVLELAVANTYSGTTTVSGGVLRLSDDLALQNSPLDISLSGADSIELTTTAPRFGGLVGSTDLADVIASGYRDVTELTLDSQAGTSQTYSGAIADGAAGMTLTKTGSGTQILSGANTYTGQTTVTAGTLQLGAGGSLTGAISNAGSLVLLQGGASASTVSGLISGTGRVAVGGGTVILSNTANTYTGQTAIDGGIAEVMVLTGTTGAASSLGAPTTADTARIDLGLGETTGTLRYVGTGHATDRPLYLAGGSGGGTLDASGSGTVAFTGGVTANAGTKTFTLTGTNAGNNVIRSIDGTGVSVTKTGAGTWVLGGTSSYTGQLVVEQGTLLVDGNAPTSGSGVFGAQASGRPAIGMADASGTASLLVVGGGTIERSFDVVAAGSGTQEVVVGGSGPGTSTFAGSAAIRLGRDVTLAADAGHDAIFKNTWQTLAGGSDPKVAIDVGTATMTGTVSLGYFVPESITAVNVRRGTLQLDYGADPLAPSTPVTVGSDLGSATLALSGTSKDTSQALQSLAFGGTAGLVVPGGGGGLLRLSGSAPVVTAAAGAGHRIESGVALDGAVTFDVSASTARLAVAGVIANGTNGVQGLLKSGSGTLALSAVNTYTGTTTVASGTLLVGTGGRIASSAGIDVESGAALAFARTDDYGGSYSNAIVGSGHLVVESGSLRLTGLNAFTGSSEVLSGAVLALDGRIDNATLDVEAGAALMGSGTILGLTTIAGLHRPGNSPGIQTLDDLTYTTGASVQWELWGNTTSNSPVAYDQIVLTGDLEFAGSTAFNLVFTGSASPTAYSEVVWADAFWASNQEWLVYDVGGTTTGELNLAIVQTNWQDSTGAFFQSVRPANSFALEKRGSDMYLVYSAAIPEPSTLALAGIGVAAAAACRRRRRR